MTKKVAIPKSLAKVGKDELSKHQIEIIELPDDKISTLLELSSDADGVIWGLAPFPNETLAKMPNLKIVARIGVGYDNLDVSYFTAHGVYVTITPKANASTVAETTVGEIFDVSKNITNDSMAMRKGDWAYKTTHMGFDLEGKTVGILGYGRIGRQVAHMVHALGMNVLIYSPHAKESPDGKVVDRETVLKDSDIVSLHMRVTPETKHSIGKREFALMKDSSVLVNLARGELVVTADLVDALKNKVIKAAALDVFDEQPLPLSSPLFKLDNVLLTPHMAANTVECMNRMSYDAASEVVLVLNGEKPLWAVTE
ncbi:3-phosphoglycerate dehydrogenase [Fructilactobacillus lindneri]|nr:phosphoglycerate dehydrogenase [Fructilactobacillus lindneri]ANZ57426.1 3-phosphoglycerate dehydrogenase [Fructilactobacillus lindneri]ANZ58693.1 3-phosphoglycerate dehydrogenase [Fructilactobacillus lindneri]POG97911.1 3-phosphoglycerate dehydrogenase [Fructilactobacillus lindneri]POG99243.1 3-phosphoglycerate dehydrogenase [Fructilactobacillus lindneri]POH01880.1 3-phosphoglycerate dehydrogenase [Fructilactobacillus lindneri]